MTGGKLCFWPMNPPLRAKIVTRPGSEEDGSKSNLDFQRHDCDV